MEISIKVSKRITHHKLNCRSVAARTGVVWMNEGEIPPLCRDVDQWLALRLDDSGLSLCSTHVPVLDLIDCMQRNRATRQRSKVTRCQP